MKWILLFSQVFFVQIALTQNKGIQRDELLFEKGLLLQELIEDELRLEQIIKSESTEKQELAAYIKEITLTQSLGYYQELIDSCPKSRLLFMALYNKGLVEFALGKNDEAKKSFQQILDSDANGKEKGGRGVGIMAEPYANYKNNASKTLAEICMKDSNYTEALKYLDLSKKYPYRHFCGNAFAQDEIYMSELYAKCYIGLNDRKKALEYLLPNLLENGLASNTKVVDLTYSTLLKDYSKEELKEKFETAFKNYKIEKNALEEETIEHYFISFLGTTMEVSDWELYYVKPEKREETLGKIYKNTRFYQLLNE